MPPAPGPSNEGGWNEIAVFLGLTFALSSIFYYLILDAGSLAGAGATIPGLMWCPGIAAMATVAWFHRHLRGLGWGAGPWRYWLWGYGSPILYAGVVYVAVWTLGLGALDHEVVQRLTPVRLLTLIPLGTLMGGLMALGEEIGWRGFLTPRLHAKLGFAKSTLLTGVIWAAWHYPLLLFADYNSGTPWWFGLTCFTILVVGISFLFAWLRLTSGSLWPAVWLHASHNLFIQGFFDRLTTDTGPTEWWIGEFGAGLAFAALGVWLLVLKRLPRRGW